MVQFFGAVAVIGSQLIGAVTAADSPTGLLTEAASCRDHDIELVMLQDGSSSFESLINAMKDKSTELVEAITAAYPSKVSLGLTSFVDKALPFRGVGNGRGVASAMDYCYKRMTVLNGEETLAQGYNALKALPGAGGDTPENPYEGIVYATQDPAIGWTPGDDVVKLLVTITDDLPHYAGDANDGIKWWNPLREGDENDGRPHFWDAEFIDSPSYYDVDAPAIYPTDTSPKDYTQLLKLHSSASPLTGDEQLEYNRLLAEVGPDSFELRPAHTGNFEDYVRCSDLEYPDLSQIGNALMSHSIVPLFLIAPPPLISTESRLLCETRGYPIIAGDETDSDQFVRCMKNVYSEDLEQMGVPAYTVLNFQNEGSDSFIKAVQDVVNEVLSKISCDQPPPTCHAVHHECETRSGTITGVAVGCAAGGAALTAIAMFFCKPFQHAPVNTEYDAYAQVERVYSAEQRDQTQVLKVEDFA